jgi:predicted RNase H-like HicB family nuclease
MHVAVPVEPTPCGRRIGGPRVLDYAALMADPTVAHLTAAVVRDGEWFVARCLEVEVASQGESVEEALANLTEALELYFEDEPLVDGPQPIVAPIEVRISA